MIVVTQLFLFVSNQPIIQPEQLQLFLPALSIFPLETFQTNSESEDFSSMSHLKVRDGALTEMRERETDRQIV